MEPRKSKMPEQAKPQIDKFKQLARELECDENEAAFDERLKKMAKGARQNCGEWHVRDLKNSSGFYALFTPNEYASEERSPYYPTRGEVYEWLAQSGRQQDTSDPDLWR